MKTNCLVLNFYRQQNLNGAQDYRVSSCTLIISIILITSQLLYLQAQLKSLTANRLSLRCSIRTRLTPGERHLPHISKQQCCEPLHAFN